MFRRRLGVLVFGLYGRGGKEKMYLLTRTRVFFMNFVLLRRGWRKLFSQVPATVTEESWPSCTIVISFKKV